MRWQGQGHLARRPVDRAHRLSRLTTDDAKLLPYDLDKAKALLKEAGYPNGLTIKIIHTQLPDMLSTMEVLQAQLRKVGINLDMEVVEHATYHANIRQDMSPIVHYAAGRFPVADVYLTQFFHSRSIVKHADRGDQLLALRRGRHGDRRRARRAGFGQAEGAVEDRAEEDVTKVCGIPMFEQPQVWARHAKLDYGFPLEGSMSSAR